MTILKIDRPLFKLNTLYVIKMGGSGLRMTYREAVSYSEVYGKFPDNFTYPQYYTCPNMMFNQIDIDMLGWVHTIDFGKCGGSWLAGLLHGYREIKFTQYTGEFLLTNPQKRLAHVIDTLKISPRDEFIHGFLSRIENSD